MRAALARPTPGWWARRWVRTACLPSPSTGRAVRCWLRPAGASVRLPPSEDGRWLRHPGRPQNDVAFLGGIDLDHGGRDDVDHRGDRQSVGADPVYGPTPAYHDVQLELRGPVVREAEETFRERWQNPAAVSWLPWHVIPDRIHGLAPHRLATAAGITCPAGYPVPARSSSCGRYPRRRPRYPYAPRGERSIALAYTKALGRAEQLIYVEDQYLWSFDVARIFAAALQRSSRTASDRRGAAAAGQRESVLQRVSDVGTRRGPGHGAGGGRGPGSGARCRERAGPSRLRPFQAVRRRRCLGGGR